MDQLLETLQRAEIIQRAKMRSRFVNGIDPTAERVGNTEDAAVSVATEETVIPPEGGEVPGGKITAKYNQADLAGANQILGGFDPDNRKIAEMFGQEPMQDFNIQVEPPPLQVEMIGSKKRPQIRMVHGPPGAIHFPNVSDPENEEPNPADIVHAENNITVNIPRNKPEMALGLADEEAVESYELRTANWDPGKTSGESLSRALGEELHPELAEYGGNGSIAPAQDWWDTGREDYINGNPDWNAVTGAVMKDRNGNPVQPDDYDGFQSQTQASDRNPFSSGAGTLFLYYLHNKLGYSWNKIIGANGETLGEKYQSLTGKSGQIGFQNFLDALPKDSKGNLILPPNGNPFSTP